MDGQGVPASEKIKSKAARSEIVSAVETLKNFPEVKNVIKLKSREQYRMRVGRWRVLFEADPSLKIISVQEVRIRDESTY